MTSPPFGPTTVTFLWPVRPIPVFGSTICEYRTPSISTNCSASPDVDAALKKGELKFVLDGEKLHGGFVLVRTGRRGEGRPSWLLIKHRDEWARKTDIADEEPRSVVSNRLLVEIARDEGGNMKRAADGDPPALLRKLLDDPKLIRPKKKSARKSVWHSNRGAGAS